MSSKTSSSEQEKAAQARHDPYEHPRYLIVKDSEIQVYYDGAEPRVVLRWEQKILQLLDEWSIKHEKTGWLISDDWPPLESRQVMTITIGDEEDEATLDDNKLRTLREALDCEYKAEAYASYAYSELFGTRNGLGIEFRVQGTLSGRLEDLLCVLDCNVAQNEPLIFHVHLRATDDPAEEAERIACELGIFLLELPEEL